MRRFLASHAVAAAAIATVYGCAPRVVPPTAGPSAQAVQAPGPAGLAARKRLRVISTNDFHGNLRSTLPTFADREVGGAAVLAAYFARERAAVDGPTVLLDGGDVMQGTPLSNLTFGRSTVDFFNLAGYTAAAIGNHEFDWGADTLAARIRQAQFAWLGANVKMKGTDTLPSWGRAAHTVVLPGCRAGPPACDSVKVGLIGVVTRTTPIAAMPSNVASFDFEDEAAAIDRWVPRLRAEGVDFVIVVAHEGARCTVGPSQDCSGPMIDAALKLRNPPDLIVSGHTHSLLDIRPAGIPMVQAGQYGTHYAVVDLERVSSDSVAVEVRGLNIAFADGVVPDSGIAAMVARVAADIGPILDRVVATLAQPLIRRGPEHALGNLIADAQRWASGATVALMNNGGIRTDLPAGTLRYEDIFRTQPFGNTLVVMDLTGANLLQAIEHSLLGGRTGGHFSGVRVRYRPEGEPGRRIVSAQLDSGAAIDPAATYRVSVNSFLAEGGDGYAMLLEGRNLQYTGIVDLDALLNYLASLPSPVAPPAVGRFTPVAGPER